MKSHCNKCGWTGNRYELVPIIKNAVNINYWCHCPKCKSNVEIPITESRLDINRCVLTIYTNTYSSSTFIHLRRILNFSIDHNNLYITGYKQQHSFGSPFVSLFSTFQLNINSNADEVILILKIIHNEHLRISTCKSRLFHNLMCFGFWPENHQYPNPRTACSFCARYYEWENNATNGWPLSHKTILNNQKQNVNVCKNNKFAKIFAEEKLQIPFEWSCCCNEISAYPNLLCQNHKNNEIDNLRALSATTGRYYSST